MGATLALNGLSKVADSGEELSVTELLLCVQFEVFSFIYREKATSHCTQKLLNSFIIKKAWFE